MRIVESDHFLGQWSKRVGKYYPRMRKLVLRSVERGEARLHRQSELGILVPITIRGETYYVIGVPVKRAFILKTVLDREIAGRLGWYR